ncbi:hypothetical protein [Streptomyces cadmiisoli]|uniref:Uncharacterized protein n=1 Tax=Streptomyces cadmiisoli TaxID=2184053 RepID=A0A2Z4J6U3_9ACTN|nr:hypothetical protein [Streptomyces cadmiisoli]AWW40789.1 hypothetical protein DN051_32340 [Streptomyces cadmiisoli]
MPRAAFGIQVTDFNDDNTEGETRWLTGRGDFKTLEAAKKEVSRMYAEFYASDFGVWSAHVGYVRVTIVKGKRETGCYSMIVDLG